jgi:alpha-mannosidase
MDISEEKGSGFGVAVLSDCKYGYDAKEKLMRLTLIKSGIFPNPNADQGRHEFTYSLYPHMGDHRAGHVIEEAQKLNRRSFEYVPEEAQKLNRRNLECLSVMTEDVAMTPVKTVVVVDALERSIIDIETSGVYVGAIKLAEDSDDVVIRLYEGHGKGKKVKARLFADSEVVLKAVCVCDLLEKSCLEGAIEYDSSTKEISVEMKPYEIQTFIVRF